MKITPIEIRQKDFNKQFRGYSMDEVDAFLYSLSMGWQNTLKILDEKEKKIEYLSKELKRIRKIEDALVKNIELFENKAENIIKDAKIESEKLLIEKREDILIKEINNIKSLLEEFNNKIFNKV